MRVAAVLLWPLIALAAPGCKCARDGGGAAPEPAAPVPALGPVSVSDLTPDQARPANARLDTEALERRAREALERAGVFAPGAGDAAAPVLARVRVELAIEEVSTEEKAAARAVVRLRIDTRPGGVAPPRWNEDVQAGAETIFAVADKPERGALFQKLVGRTIDDLLGAYVARQRLWGAEPSAVRAALKGDAGELQMEAIRLVGERKLRGEVPSLLELLDHPEETVRDAALGALVELREARAVSVLAGNRSMKDKREMRKILDAVAVLGGPEADDYLAFVAAGHEDPEIKEMASAARERLRRRQGRAADAGR